jgi:hypothetical protein
MAVRLDPGSYACLMRVCFENFMELHSSFDAGSIPPRPPPAWNTAFDPAPRLGLRLAGLRPAVVLTVETGQLKVRGCRGSS